MVPSRLVFLNLLIGALRRKSAAVWIILVTEWINLLYSPFLRPSCFWVISPLTTCILLSKKLISSGNSHQALLRC